jgi:Fanconi-associated nuclease 1
MGSSSYGVPAAKRLRRLDDADSSTSRGGSDSDAEDAEAKSLYISDIPFRQGTGDQDVDDSGEIATSQTEQELSLPPVGTDKEAIAEYETSRMMEERNGTEQKDLEKRFGNRTWQKGRSSIYVDAFNLTLETVLNEESHLFDEAELAIFKQWKDLIYESQYLYAPTSLFNSYIPIILNMQYLEETHC